MSLVPSEGQKSMFPIIEELQKEIERLKKENDQLQEQLKNCNLHVSVSTSKDYKRLFEMISKGLIVPCFVDYDWRDGSTPSRDIAKVRRFKENDIQIGARGIQYGGVEDFSLHGRTEFEAFAEECTRMNLEYCC